MTPSQAASGGPAPAPVSDRRIYDLRAKYRDGIERVDPANVHVVQYVEVLAMAEEIERTRALLREAKPALESGIDLLALEVAENQHRADGYSAGSPFAAKYQNRANVADEERHQLRKLIEACP